MSGYISRQKHYSIRISHKTHLFVCGAAGFSNKRQFRIYIEAVYVGWNISQQNTDMLRWLMKERSNKRKIVHSSIRFYYYFTCLIVDLPLASHYIRMYIFYSEFFCEGNMVNIALLWVFHVESEVGWNSDEIVYIYILFILYLMCICWKYMYAYIFLIAWSNSCNVLFLRMRRGFESHQSRFVNKLSICLDAIGTFEKCLKPITLVDPIGLMKQFRWWLIKGFKFTKMRSLPETITIIRSV